MLQICNIHKIFGHSIIHFLHFNFSVFSVAILTWVSLKGTNVVLVSHRKWKDERCLFKNSNHACKNIENLFLFFFSKKPRRFMFFFFATIPRQNLHCTIFVELWMSESLDENSKRYLGFKELKFLIIIV